MRTGSMLFVIIILVIGYIAGAKWPSWAQKVGVA